MPNEPRRDPPASAVLGGHVPPGAKAPEFPTPAAQPRNATNNAKPAAAPAPAAASSSTTKPKPMTADEHRARAAAVTSGNPLASLLGRAHAKPKAPTHDQGEDD